MLLVIGKAELENVCEDILLNYKEFNFAFRLHKIDIHIKIITHYIFYV